MLFLLQTYHILINMDIRSDEQEAEDPFSKKGEFSDYFDHFS